MWKEKVGKDDLSALGEVVGYARRKARVFKFEEGTSTDEEGWRTTRFILCDDRNLPGLPLFGLQGKLN